MRTSVVAIALVLVAFASGCTAAEEQPGSSQSQTPSATPSATPSDDDAGAVVDSEACDEVRAGIDAFNEGDFEGTVEHFEAAVPLAEARDDGSQAAGDLVDAVHYYADLAPEDYTEAAASSPDFLKYKNITLGQCRPAGSDDPESPGTDV